MFPTRIRPVAAVFLAAACCLFPGIGRPDDKDKGVTREQMRKELESKLVGRTPDEMLVVLTQLAHEWTARKGGYEVAHHRFTVQAGEVTKAQQRLADLKEPVAKAPLILRAVDVEAAIKVAQQHAEFANTRVQTVEGLKTAFTAATEALAEFGRAATSAEDQLFKMESAVSLAKGVPNDKLPPAVAWKATTDAATKIKSLRVSTADALQGVTLAKIDQQLVDAKTVAAAATASFDELKRNREAMIAAFAYEDQVKGMNPQQLTDEFTKLRKQLSEKTTAIKGDAEDYAKAAPPIAEARAKLAAIKDPPVPEAKSLSGPPLELAAQQLFTAQQYLGARVRTHDERTEKTAALVAALDDQENKAKAYAKTLDDARQAAVQLAAVAAEIERRVGRGDLDPAKAPEGVAEAAGSASASAKLSADLLALQKTLTELRAERDHLRTPDADADNLKAQTAAMLAKVSERIDLLTDIKKLTADYATARKDRPESEQRRLDQRAAERRMQDGNRWDWVVAFDRSPHAVEVSGLLDAYYKELIDLDDKADNLQLQKAALERLVDLTRKEADDIGKLRTLLNKPVEVSGAGEPKVDVKVDVEKLRAQLARIEAAKQWDAWLAARITPTGLKAEASLYHDELARLAVVGGANGRRVLALTGNPPLEVGKVGQDPTKLPANGGEIAKARNELFDAHVRGWTITGIKIGAVLLAALVIPRVIMFMLRRGIRGGTDSAGNLSPVLSVLRRVLKFGTWIGAIALILSVFGYDVTALVVALAIGVLAIALAARPMIADVLGSVVIFAERRFQVGDVVRLGGGEPARVVGLTWRSTALKNASGLVSSVPNRKVTELTVENLSRSGETYDSLLVTVSTDKDAGKVIGVIRAALAQCKNLTPDQGVTVLKFNQKGFLKVVEYRFWWFLKDYDTRNKTRDEVFARIAVGLANEDMTGIEVSLA